MTAGDELLRLCTEAEVLANEVQTIAERYKIMLTNVRTVYKSEKQKKNKYLPLLEEVGRTFSSVAEKMQAPQIAAEINAMNSAIENYYSAEINDDTIAEKKEGDKDGQITL